jgi:acyl-CoA reductase-like NAD-dependent aldehyde dehydrogenase
MSDSVAAHHARLLIDGRWCDGVDRFAVLDKYAGAVVGRCERASREQVDAAVAAARRSFDTVKLEPY